VASNANTQCLPHALAGMSCAGPAARAPGSNNSIPHLRPPPAHLAAQDLGRGPLGRAGLALCGQPRAEALLGQPKVAHLCAPGRAWRPAQRGTACLSHVLRAPGLFLGPGATPAVAKPWSGLSSWRHASLVGHDKSDRRRTEPDTPNTNPTERRSAPRSASGSSAALERSARARRGRRRAPCAVMVKSLSTSRLGDFSSRW